MLFVVLFVTLFLIFLSVKRYRKLFNPFTLSIQIPLFFLILPQLVLIFWGEGEDSVLSDIVILLFVCSIYVGTLFKLKHIAIVEFHNKRMIIGFSILLILILLAPMIPMLLSFGLSLKGLRSFYEVVVFSSHASFYEILKTLLFLIIVFLFTKYKRFTFFTIFLIIILCFSGSKMAILNTVIILSTMYEEYKVMNYKKMIFCFSFVFVFLLYYHFVQSDQVSVIQAAFSYFDVYKQQTLALNMFVDGDIEYFYGKLSSSSWYKVIPRFIWPSKPTDFGFALLNYKIYPEFAANGYMPSFGLAYSFADFGFFSIISSGFIMGFMKNYFYRVFYKSSKNTASFILYVFNIDVVIFILFGFYYFISSLKKNDT